MFVSTPRRPARLAVYSESGTFYPRELTELNGKLYFTNDSGSDTVMADSNATITIKNSAGQVLGTVKPATGGEITLDIPDVSKYVSVSDTEEEVTTEITNNYVSANGDTMEGILVAQNNTAYTTKQVRNIFLSTSEPSASDGDNGDIWFVYEA